jgi:hypothetical protein
MTCSNKQKTYHDKKGESIKLSAKFNGYTVEGGALVVHTKATTGEVVAVNGDYVDGSSLDNSKYQGEEGLKDCYRDISEGEDCEITSPAYLTVVNEEGRFAWAV